MKKELTFSLIGGTMQPEVSSFADFPAILELDDACWALTSISRYAMRADARLLDYLDTDGNGRIRCDEVREAIRFVLEHFASGRGFDAASSVLDFADLAPDHPDSTKIRCAAQNVLEKLGKGGSGSISIDDLRDNRELRANASFAEGGKLPVGDGGSPEAENLIGLICRCLGCPAVGIEEVDRFVSGAAQFMRWRDSPSADREKIFPFGDATRPIVEKADSVEHCVDDYFLQCETLSFLSGADGRAPRRELNADPLDAGEIADVLQKLTLAEPRTDGALDLTAPLHPLYRGALLESFSLAETRKFLDAGRLSRTGWENFKALVAPYRKWRAEKPEFGDFFNDFSASEIAAFAGRAGFSPLEDAIRRNQDVASGIRLLCKALLFQRDMLKFLRNYVSLADLFDSRSMSMLRRGELILDARHFTLITPVENLDSHKRITQGSNICIAYIAVDYGADAKVPVQTMAVGITSGDMKRLFIGKHGVFLDPSGAMLDAVIVDFVEQPVSFWEALKSPFVNFGRMIAEQTDKLFSPSSAQKSLPIVVGNPAAPAAAPSSGLSMLVMSGGIGIAAIGGAVAFIANTLRTVSFLYILCAVAGIFLLFSGPPTIHSLIKLFHRDLGRFLEASGCAVNFPMRLSNRLGYYFTRKPGYRCVDLIPSGKRRTARWIFWSVLLAIALGVAGFFIWRHFRAEDPVPETPVPESFCETSAEDISREEPETSGTPSAPEEKP
ncbi:MAG: hypothetical protein MJ016_02525 [Victivallaceae bacterium]|nr:hypothetical protein [Victivallaceae bacterium]